MAGPFEALSVARLGGGVASAYACRLLADLGAAVTWIEAPDGDPLRQDCLFDHLAASVGSVVAIEPEDVAEAAGGAGLVVEGLGPGGLERAAPALVDASAPGALVRISPAGSHGPERDLPDDDLLVQAAGGWVSNHGDPGGDPVRVGGRAPAWVVGSFAAVAGLTAWRLARQRRERVVADLAAKECLVGTLAYPMLFQRTLAALGAHLERRRYVVPGIVPCADGWVGINALTGQHWADVCVLVGAPEFDGRQPDVLGDEATYAAFLDAAGPWLSGHTAEEIVDLCQAFRIPAAPIGDGRTLPELSHFRDRGVYTRRPDGVRAPRPPYRFSSLALAARGPAPGLGSGPAAGAGAGPPPVPASVDEPLPFAGLRVVDLGIFWAAPYLTLYLASMGADVVKVESVQRPDGFRYTATFPQLGDDWFERSLVWQATNLGKRSVTLDLTSADGLDLAWRLVDRADVLVENFSPRVVDDLGLGVDAVTARRPDLVYLRMPGFGLDGPWRDHVGWAMSYEQATGLAAVTGFPERGPLNPGGFADPVVGLHAAVALHAALEHRARTGEGQVVEIPQADVLAAITAEQVIRVDQGEPPMARTGNAGPSGTDRVVERDGRWVAESGAGSWDVLTVDEMAGDPQLAARGWYEALDHPVTGPAEYPGWPFRLTPGPARAHRSPAPTLGQHNAEVLAEVGVDEAALAALVERGVVGTRPVGG